MTDEAVGEGSSAADNKIAENTTADLAKAAVVIYCLLWMLHGVLMLAPSIPRSDDVRLRRFDRAKAEAKVIGMREKEGGMLRDIHERIRTVSAEERQDFIREAIPVAAQLNKAVGWPALSVPGGAAEPTLSEAPLHHAAQQAANAHADAAGAESSTAAATTGPPDNGNNPPDDIFKAIFG